VAHDLFARSRPGLGIIEPCLPSPDPPSGPGWLHEIKHDGFRIMARRDGAGVRLITRAGNDFSSRFPFIAMAISKLPVRSCLIDGEAIVCDESGLAVFDLIRRHGALASDVHCAFDLLQLDGRDLRREPIETRKVLLAKLLKGSHLSIVLNEHFDRERVPGSVSARLRGYCKQAPWLTLSLRSLTALGEDQKPQSTGSRARGGGRLGSLRDVPGKTPITLKGEIATLLASGKGGQSSAHIG
jgi:hypothetical protein